MFPEPGAAEPVRRRVESFLWRGSGRTHTTHLPATSLPSLSPVLGLCCPPGLSRRRGLPARPANGNIAGRRAGKPGNCPLSAARVTFLTVATAQSCSRLPPWSCSCWWPGPAQHHHLLPVSLQPRDRGGRGQSLVSGLPVISDWPFGSPTTCTAGSAFVFRR